MGPTRQRRRDGTGHAPAVKEILEAAIEQFEGEIFVPSMQVANGWVVRLLNGMPNCTQAMGVDEGHDD